MGVKLSRVDKYTLSSRTGSRDFFKGVEVHDLSEQDEKFCLELGYFHYVPSPGKNVPENIAKTDKNIQLRLDGVIDGKGNPIASKTEVSTEKKADERQILDIEMDENGNPVFVKPGTSSLDADVPKELLDAVQIKTTSGKFKK